MDVIHCETCPGKPKLEVMDSRPHKFGAAVTARRRRRCPVCNTRHNTVEVPAEWASFYGGLNFNIPKNLTLEDVRKLKAIVTP